MSLAEAIRHWSFSCDDANVFVSYEDECDEEPMLPFQLVDLILSLRREALDERARAAK